MAISLANYSYGKLITGAEPSLTNDNQKLVITEANVDADFWLKVQNGGGDIRLAEAVDGVNQLPVEVLLCDTVLEKLILHTNKPSYAVADRDICLFCGTVGTDTQPSPSSAFGSESVYSDTEYLNHMDGTGLRDSSDSSDGTYESGTPSSVAGVIGNARDFTSEGIATGKSILASSTGFRVGAWVKWEGAGFGDEGSIVDAWNSSNRSMMLRYDPTGQFEFATFENGSSPVFLNISYSLAGLNPKKVDAVLSGGVKRLYIDGVQVGATQASSGLSEANPSNFKVGRSLTNNFGNDFWIGVLDEVVVDAPRTQSYLKTEFDNQSDPSSFWTQSASFDPSASAGTSYTLTVDSVSMTQLLTEPSITQESALNTQSVNQSLAMGNVSLDQLQSISASGLTQNNAIESAALTQGYLLAVDDIAQQQLVELSNLSVGGTLSAQAISQIQQLTEAAISQQGTLSADGVSQSSSIDNLDLTQAFTLLVDSISNTESISEPSVGQFNGLIVQSLSNNHLVSASGLIQAGVLVIDSVTQEQGLGFITFEDEPRILTLRATIGKSDISVRIALSDITARIGG